MRVFRRSSDTLSDLIVEVILLLEQHAAASMVMEDSPIKVPARQSSDCPRFPPRVHAGEQAVVGVLEIERHSDTNDLSG